MIGIRAGECPWDVVLPCVPLATFLVPARDGGDDHVRMGLRWLQKGLRANTCCSEDAKAQSGRVFGFPFTVPLETKQAQERTIARVITVWIRRLTMAPPLRRIPTGSNLNLVTEATTHRNPYRAPCGEE